MDTESLISSMSRNGNFRHHRQEILVTLCTWFAPLSLGCVLGYSSPSIPPLQSENLLVGNQASWYGSLITVGALFGSYFAGWMVEKFGRKASIVFSTLPFVIGWFLITVAHDYIPLYAGRIVTGFAGGMTTLCVPLYLAEISSQHIRGILGASFQIGTTSGILVVYTMGLFLTWRWLAVFCATFPTLLIFFMQLTPETPRYLVMKGNVHKARQSLCMLRMLPPDHASINSEIEGIKHQLQEDLQQPSISWSDFSKPDLYRPLVISLTLMVLQQLCGINAVIFYTESVFQSAGYSGNAGIPSIIVAAVKVAVTCVSTGLMDRVGRRKLFLAGGGLLSLSCLAFGSYFYLSSMGQHISWLSLASLTIYVTGFSLGWGSIPWLIMSEIFPTKARGRAAAVATGLNWSCAFLVTLGFLPLQAAITPQGIFWAFAGVSFTGTVIMFCLMPETKGRFLEDIQLYFNQS